MENAWTEKITRLEAEKAELLEVCRAFLTWRSDIETHEREPRVMLDDVIRQARAVIAKAERKEP